MRVTVELNTPEVEGPSAAHLVLRDVESSLPVAEIAIRGAGYIVLTQEERLEIAEGVLSLLNLAATNENGVPYPYHMNLPDREGGYHGEPPLWTKVAEEQAAKRGVTRVVKVGGKKVKVPQSLEDIAYPEGAKFGADGIIIVPSRKGETADMKRFRRACKRARAQQYAFLESQKNPDAVEDGEEDEDSND
jgi:hypothetical protein